jgi:hypothetical protein
MGWGTALDLSPIVKVISAKASRAGGQREVTKACGDEKGRRVTDVFLGG